MIHDIIKTNDYLIIVDDSEIKEGDFCIANGVTYNNIIVKYMKSPCPPPYVSNLSILKKIIAHLPLTISPVLEGVDLLLPLEGDDCDSLQGYVESLSQPKYPVAFEQEDEVINETYTSVTRKGDGYTLWIGKYIY